MSTEPPPKYNFSNDPARPAPNPPPTASSDSYSAYKSAAPPSAAVGESEPNPLRLFVGIALGLLVGLLGAFLYAKFVFFTHLSLSLLTAGIGWGVGLAVLIGGGRGGLLPGLLGGGISLIAMVFSRFLLLADMVGSEYGGASLPLTGETLVLTLQSFVVNPFSLIIAAIGVYGGFILPYRAGEQQTSTLG